MCSCQDVCNVGPSKNYIICKKNKRFCKTYLGLKNIVRLFSLIFSCDVTLGVKFYQRDVV